MYKHMHPHALKPGWKGKVDQLAYTMQQVLRQLQGVLTAAVHATQVSSVPGAHYYWSSDAQTKVGNNALHVQGRSQAAVRDAQESSQLYRPMQGDGDQGYGYRLQCAECGRRHPSYAPCYGRNFERAPHR